MRINFKLIAVASLGINLAGGLAWWWQHRLNVLPEVREWTLVGQVQPPAADSTTPNSSRFQWSLIESPNYPAYIANLRKIGCPEQTVRDIVISDLCHVYGVEWKKRFVAANTNYWESAYGQGAINSEALQTTALKMRTELDKAVLELLGVDLSKELQKYAEVGSVRPDKEYFLSAFLPHEVVAPVARALEKYETLRQSAANGAFLTRESIIEQMHLLVQEQKELNTWLDAQQLEQVEVRFSDLAQEIRTRMPGFDLKEDEFKRMYSARKLQREAFFNWVINAPGPLSADALLAANDKSQLQENQLRELLGKARYLEFEKSQDYLSRSLDYFKSEDSPPLDPGIHVPQN